MRKVVWNLRSSDVSPTEAHPLTRAAVRAGALLSSRIPARIVCCAQSVRAFHAGLGYDVSRAVCIPNGVDIAAFVPDATARDGVRRELGIAPDAALIGLFARLDPQKDHRTFLAAAARLQASSVDAHFVLAGPGTEQGNPRLNALMSGLARPDRMHLLGERRDIARLTAALDVAACSSAWGEGFPNVIAEAMACEVPCASTDVGDARAIIGDTGMIVPRRAPDALAEAWRQLLSMPAEQRRNLGARARRRVAENFDFRAAVQQYARLYRDLAGEA